MLAGTNLSIDPNALLQDQHQQTLFEADTASSRTTSTSSIPRVSTPDTPDTENDDDDFEEDLDEIPRKPNTRSKTKKPAASTKSRTTTTTTLKPSSTKSKRASTAAGAADKRRKRNLERNRAAASKCRQRKKQWQDGLERRKMELESRYKSLHSECAELTEEVAQLKNFVMAHAACNDANIDDWIRNEADKYVRRMSSTQMQQAIQLPPGSQAVGSMAQLQSPTQSALTATPPMNDTLNSMFAPPGSKGPFDTAIADTSDQTNIFDQDLLMVSSMQA
ncbi:activating transcription factor 7a [Cordyceps fumosorosea ARSEF 2679]|uniref:Activating transcription factor 7a n=1 Tax=Cordyceps fumosorosea (strain ARSEF 2679) TaxID=1081104 RepID=A0A167Q0L8_CORFA|nr:activating transcription factor 7a [Cordyceps fumosorosea ARSEF 2679]OAA57181.1 activating transcription factor 7a [Cordyceps fumosorosea ARSEF 2679]